MRKLCTPRPGLPGPLDRAQAPEDAAAGTGRGGRGDAPATSGGGGRGGGANPARAVGPMGSNEELSGAGPAGNDALIDALAGRDDSLYAG